MDSAAEGGGMMYGFDGFEFEVYQAPSNDWCVTVSEYGMEPKNYNLGSLEAAYEFVLSYAALEVSA